MSDLCGQADKVIEMRINAAIETARNFKRELEPSGRCYNCDEYLDHPSKLFCDSDCSEDYEKLKRNASNDEY